MSASDLPTSSSTVAKGSNEPTTTRMYSKADVLNGIYWPRQVQADPIKRFKPSKRKRPHYRGSKSGYMGVIYVASYPKKPWKAYIRHQGQFILIGHYETKNEAAAAFNWKAKNLYGEKAYLNSIKS